MTHTNTTPELEEHIITFLQTEESEHESVATVFAKSVTDARMTFERVLSTFIIKDVERVTAII